jgi:hypothetical protein
MGDKRNAHKFILRKPEGKAPLGRPRRTEENIIRIDLNKMVEVQNPSRCAGTKYIRGAFKSNRDF